MAFGSPVIAATTVVLNLLSSAASFGFLTVVFQGRWAEGLLGFDSTEHVVSWVPLMLFVVLSGLSLDYHVFVVSRIKEARESGLPTRDAIERGTVRTAGVITSAALVMVGVFSVFGALSFIELKQIGVGLGMAILLDATVLRVLVLPSLMNLLGEANWWAPFRSARAPRGRRASRRRCLTAALTPS